MRLATGPIGVWLAFVVVHAYLLHAVSLFPGQLDGDVDLYRSWAASGLVDGVWPVLDTDWVYPVGALAPITLPGLVSLDPEAYRALFQVMVVALDGLGVAALLAAGRRSGARTTGAWWWLAFLAALGPVTLTRLDGVAAALTVVALAVLVPSASGGAAPPQVPRVSDGVRTVWTTTLATAAAWVKIAPGAVVVPLALTSPRPWRRVVLPGALVSAILVGGALVGGAGSRVWGFLGQQDDRALQVEAGPATPFSVARLWRDDIEVVFDAPLKVLEITGPGTQWWAGAMNVFLVAAVALVTAATWLAARRLRGQSAPEPEPVAEHRDDRVLHLVLLSTLALTLCLFAFNKVGSPQYVAWFAPPVAVALAAFAGPRSKGGRDGRSPRRSEVWPWLGAALLVVALLTQRLFPDHYDDFLTAVPLDVWLAAVRNVLVLALAVGVTVLVATTGRRARSRPARGDGARATGA
ncbi:hypothetical protein GCM10025865_10830 [Paraoerskovia sediminicola]|uniref:DUF2029 domain-containing protein n=1 Tax=Paraoerskovia sediminicola TaxID=1138587 RepID=A0ABM8G143_9CELL|nr:hypothetical protein [Paraoerskovia sediminicola]BDZ41784.1 hypothetical protein GCM10025865_10830 [Paraoerskovia sediminicola]